MGIARNTQQLMLLKGERIYHSMTNAKSVIKDHKVKLRTHPKCFTGRYNTILRMCVCLTYSVVVVSLSKELYSNCSPMPQ